MNRESRHVCLLLGIESRGENLQLIRALSRDSGLIFFLRRRSRRTSPPDLFQSVAIRLRYPSEGPAFLEDLEPLGDRAGIGKNYHRLQAASRFASILLRNSEHLEDPAGLYEKATQVLDAFLTTNQPGPCLLKGIFEIARIEGLPVREDWLQNLSVPDEETARTVLFNPLDSIPAATANAVPPLIDALEIWLQKSADWKPSRESQR